MDLLILPLLLLLVASSAASPAPESPTPTSADSPDPTTTLNSEYRLLYIKNVKPYVLSDPHMAPIHRRYRRHRHHGRHRGGKSTTAGGAAVKQGDAWANRRSTSRHVAGPRPFYVMLPKGYVPPSGSSPCHNLYPTATAADDGHYFDCHYFPISLKP